MKVNCPHCGQKFSIEEDQLGLEAVCHQCNTKFVLEAPKVAGGFLDTAKVAVSRAPLEEVPKVVRPGGRAKQKTLQVNSTLGNTLNQEPQKYKKSFNFTPIIAGVVILVIGAGVFLGYQHFQNKAKLELAEKDKKEAEIKEAAQAEAAALAEAEALAEAKKKSLEAERQAAKAEKRRLAAERKKQRLQEELAAKGHFELAVVPVLENYCTDCHDEVDQAGDLNLELFFEEKYAELEPRLWENLAKVVSLGQMPPHKRKQMTKEDKTTLLNWIDELSNKWDSGEMGTDPGKTTIHRLNKYEYNYTIRDLFGLSVWLVGGFPEDATADSGFSNNADSLFLPALLVENYFEAAEKIVEHLYSKPELRKKYLIAKPVGKSPAEAAETVITYWAAKVYRRPPTKDEVSKLLALAIAQMDKKKPYEQAMQMPLFAMLVSPNFLYRATFTDEQSGTYPIDDFELASKLSYFLWSSMPDNELLSLAKKGELSKDDVLEAQVKRMLQDNRASSLGKHLGGQWFGWEDLRSASNPDEERFPQFDFDLRIALYQESSLYFDHIVKTNGSIYDFLDSDYTFLNNRLSRFYKLPVVAGNNLRLVKLEDKNRGGVLGMGSVLTTTSTALRSSPSIRGAYVLRDVLGYALPEPPMNVEPLPDDEENLKKLTARESLAKHRENPDCRACHKEIDPIGFGLESFDAIGRFRTHQNGLELDVSGQFPDGSKFNSPSELKAALLNNKEQFAKNAARKFLTYALGRELSPYDRPVIKQISDKIIENDGSIHTAFIEIVKSYPFKNRRGEEYKVTKPGS